MLNSIRKFIYGLFGFTLASVFIIIFNLDVEWSIFLKVSGIPIIITGTLLFVAGLREGDLWQKVWGYFKGTIIFFGFINLVEAIWYIVLERGTITTFEAIFYSVVLFAILFTVSDWVSRAINNQSKPVSR